MAIDSKKLQQGLESVSKIPEDLWSLENLDSITIHFNPKYTFTAKCRASISYEKDDCSATKNFEGETMDEVMYKMYNFLKGL